MDEKEFLGRKSRGVSLPPGTVWTECSQVAWTCISFLVNEANQPKFIQLFGHIPKHALERIIFKESLASILRLINNTQISLILMLAVLVIKLRWYTEVLSFNCQN